MKGAVSGGGVGALLSLTKRYYYYIQEMQSIKGSNLSVTFNLTFEQKLFIVFLFSLIFISFPSNKTVYIIIYFSLHAKKYYPNYPV